MKEFPNMMQAMRQSVPRASKPAASRDGAAPAKKRSATAASSAKSGAGRPPKYAGPSRPITVTLPESTLRDLESIHRDRGRAIVKLTEAAMMSPINQPPLVEIVEMAANTGILLVGPSEVLCRIPFLHMVEVAPGRFLLALDPGNDFTDLEIAMHDALEDVPAGNTRERELIGELLAKMKHMRKAESVSRAEVLLVKLARSVGSKARSLVHTMACLFAVGA